METVNASSQQEYRKSLRLKHYDYSSAGAYFLTLCTQNRACLFGEIIGEEMVLNKNGEIVRDELQKTTSIRPMIEMDTYAVMPDHLHMVVWIKYCSGDLPVARPSDGRISNIVTSRLKSGSVGAFIAGFKSSVTKRINETRRTLGVPVWQQNYYEHVIRNENDLNEIREYVLYNPLKWALDKENPAYKW